MSKKSLLKLVLCVSLPSAYAPACGPLEENVPAAAPLWDHAFRWGR